jgi:hypothetical protein
MEVVFHGGRLPSFQNVPYCFELYYSRPKTVRKQKLLISCYFKLFRANEVIFYCGRLPWRSSSILSKFLLLFCVLIDQTNQMLTAALT